MAKINQACHDAGIAVFFGQADHRLDRRDFAPLIVDRGHDGKPGDPPNRFYTYGVIARLANLAAAIEVEELAARGSTLEARAANA